MCVVLISKDDLVVGAPFYFDRGVGGAIYVYLSTSGQVRTYHWGYVCLLAHIGISFVRISAGVFIEMTWLKSDKKSVQWRFGLYSVCDSVHLMIILLSLLYFNFQKVYQAQENCSLFVIIKQAGWRLPPPEKRRLWVSIIKYIYWISGLRFSDSMIFFWGAAKCFIYIDVKHMHIFGTFLALCRLLCHMDVNF